MGNTWVERHSEELEISILWETCIPTTLNKLLYDHDESQMYLMVILSLFSSTVLGLVPASDECRYTIGKKGPYLISRCECDKQVFPGHPIHQFV